MQGRLYSALVLLAVARLASPHEETVYASGAPTITQENVESWALKISAQLEAYERRVLDRPRLAKSLETPPVAIDGAALVNEVAQKIGAIASGRAAAAGSIAKAAEALAQSAGDRKTPLPKDTTFQPSVELDLYKSWLTGELDNAPCQLTHSCRSYRPVHLDPSTQFNANITKLFSSVHVPVETYDCDHRVLPDIHRTEELDNTFRKNYANDSTFSWQYFCSARGFMRHYPGASWSSMAGAAIGPDDDEPDLFDCRLRTWYVEATGAPRDVLVLLDATGSITQLKQLIAFELMRELLTALTDDDHVNVLRFNQKIGVRSPISCFEDKLVPANHVNVAAMLHNLSSFEVKNTTHLPDVLLSAVTLLNSSRHRLNSPVACQQALVLIADDVPENLTATMRLLEPEGRIRVFVFIMEKGKIKTEHGEQLACDNDGYFAQLEGPSDVREQVRKVLNVLERPGVLHHQAHHNDVSSIYRVPPVWSDVYAHVQDARFSMQRWRQKEKDDQWERYMRLRRHRASFLAADQLDRDFRENYYKTTLGHYSEEDEVPYQLVISVAVPAFDPIERENVTVVLMEERQRFSTREERVARLLGVAGVDIPVNDLRLRLPHHKLGSGGSLFLIDHRGNVILHDDFRPVVAGKILKPGYRTVDLLDVEIPDDDRPPRSYSPELVQFREAIMGRESGKVVLPAVLVPLDGRLRVLAGARRYFWRRVRDTGYTAVVSLPESPDDARVLSLPPLADRILAGAGAARAHLALNDTDFAVHPDWLYCRYMEQRFERTEDEVLHFLRRISEEPDFAYEKLHFHIRKLPPGLLDLPYICDKELMARLAWEAHATAWFSSSGEEKPEEGIQRSQCALGSTTVFVATAAGLTRWQQMVVPGDAPNAIISADTGNTRAATEVWYRRAVAAGPETLVVHAPIAPTAPKGFLTAARALRHFGVTGFHFRTTHLGALMAGVTAPVCETGAKCEVSCSSDHWSCILVDEEGWVIAGSPPHAASPPIHLASAHPLVMRQLLAARLFRQRWLHDYQAVCFPLKRVPTCAAPKAAPPGARIFRWLVESLRHVLLSAHYALRAFMLMMTAAVGDAAAKPKPKLFDPRVCVNQTLPATCDRRRALYSLRSDPDAILARQQLSCSDWSLIAARVPRTNLLLLAVYRLCDETDVQPPDDPMHNLEVEPPGPQTEPLQSRLACERNSSPARLTVRGPAAVCYAHSREQEVEFRKCGPRIADEEDENQPNPSPICFA